MQCALPFLPIFSPYFLQKDLYSTFNIMQVFNFKKPLMIFFPFNIQMKFLTKKNVS